MNLDRDHYQGFILDGPWEGREFSHQYPMFKIVIWPDMSVCDPISEIRGDEIVTEVIYKWHDTGWKVAE